MMKKKYIKFVLFFFSVVLFLLPTVSQAKHIVGGDVTYRFIGRQGTQVTFEVTFTMYRDSQGGGAQFDDPARFGLYRGNANSWAHVQTYIENSMDIANINIDTGNPCLEVPTGIGV